MTKKPNQNAHHAAVCKLHALGVMVLKADKLAKAKHDGRYCVGSIAKVRKQTKNKWSKGFLHTARLFAVAYPSGDRLNWFLKLGCDEGRPLTRSHAIRLTGVRDDKLRDKVARKCALEGWSVTRLIEELQKVRGKRAYGGQRPARPRDATAALLDLERMSRRWIRWAAQLEVEDPNETGGGVTLKDLPQGVGKRLKNICEQVSLLNEAIGRQRKASAEKKAAAVAEKRPSAGRRRPATRKGKV